MSDDVRFERLLADVLSDVAPTRVPDRLVPDILAAASHTRRRPRWLALATEPPMRRRAEVLVGSPTVRLAYPLLMAALLALLAVAARVVGGIVRPPELTVVVVPSPSLQGIVAPSPTPSGPPAGPTASPVTSPAGIGSPRGRWARHASTTHRSGFSMAECSLWGANGLQRRDRDRCRVVRPGHRDLVRHREPAEAPRGLLGHPAARRQGAHRRYRGHDGE